MAQQSEYTARLFSDEELLALPWLVVEPNWLRNPFAHVINDPIGGENAHRWCIVHGEIADPDAPPAEFDPFEDLLADTTLGPSPMVEVGGGKPGYGYALFPRVPPQSSRAYQDDWETRSLEMHANQSQIDINSLPEKAPKEPRQPGARPTFHSTMDKAPPLKFEDLPPEVRRGMFRGN
jgi:hypothetical protein